MKFLPTYSLKLEVSGGKNVEITLPRTVEFTVRRESLASSQSATFIVYNLGEQDRDAIYKDRFNLTERRAIQFRAGYPDIGQPLVFNGTIQQAYSERPGEDWRTVIECYDGAYAMVNGFSSVTLGAGATFADIIATLNKDLPGLASRPIIGSFPTKTRRGSVYLGNTWQHIVQISSGLANIDNGQLKVLNQNEVLQAEIPVINGDSGLLGSPKRANTMIEYTMIFEPRLTVGQLVQLQSSTNTLFNGAYKVAGFVHRGTISAAVDRRRTTDVSLWKGTEALKTIPGAAVQ